MVRVVSQTQKYPESHSRSPPFLLLSPCSQVEWRDDLRRVLKQAGAQFQPTAFLFSDTQLKDESFLEDINNILNTGEVPNLFPKVDEGRTHIWTTAV